MNKMLANQRLQPTARSLRSAAAEARAVMRRVASDAKWCARSVSR
jgi:hypothetical protein